jgi:hypothetical protein
MLRQHYVDMPRSMSRVVAIVIAGLGLAGPRVGVLPRLSVEPG